MPRSALAFSHDLFLTRRPFILLASRGSAAGPDSSSITLRGYVMLSVYGQLTSLSASRDVPQHAQVRSYILQPTGLVGYPGFLGVSRD